MNVTVKFHNPDGVKPLVSYEARKSGKRRQR